MTIKEIISTIERVAPLALQEGYDNSGVQVGDVSQECSSALVVIDLTEEVVDEAIERGINLVISHHPLIFKPIRSLTGANYVERTIIKAIRHNIVLYSAHTNLDACYGGVSFRMAEKLGLKSVKVLQPRSGLLLKLVTYVPPVHAEAVRDALFAAGAGEIGNYSECCYNGMGTGTFKANDQADPFVGRIGVREAEPEVRIETVLPSYLRRAVVAALKGAHPYEEPVFDIITLGNSWDRVGFGVVGELPEEVDMLEQLKCMKATFGAAALKHSTIHKKGVRRVALCGGSGASLLGDAVAAGADLFLTSEIKYHDFFLHENRITIAEIGHYESEQYTKEAICDIIHEKFPTFALHFAEEKTNPINYII
ncbi:MAG: Nif3-like dinuclear metal center hexameric protein [Bacteroidales bacterium]